MRPERAVSRIWVFFGSLPPLPNLFKIAGRALRVPRYPAESPAAPPASASRLRLRFLLRPAFVSACAFFSFCLRRYSFRIARPPPALTRPAAARFNGSAYLLRFFRVFPFTSR